jgi:hypothetical protein
MQNDSVENTIMPKISVRAVWAEVIIACNTNPQTADCLCRAMTVDCLCRAMTNNSINHFGTSWEMISSNGRSHWTSTRDFRPINHSSLNPETSKQKLVSLR